MAGAATLARPGTRWHELTFDEALELPSSCWERDDAGLTAPFQRRDWFAAWHGVATPEERASAFAIARYDDASAVWQILPLARRIAPIGVTRPLALTWAGGDLGCPDHLDLPFADNGGIDDLARTIATLEWDVLMLDNLRQDAPRAVRLAEELARIGCHLSIRPMEPCPVLDLPTTWDEYLAVQSPTRRQTIRRKERKLEREHRVVVRDHGAATFDEGWRTLTTLHSERWGQDTAFSPRAAALHRAFARTLASRDALWLTTLELDGVAAAAWYGFTEGDAVFFFQSGRSVERQHDSVGQVLMGMMIRRAIERGFRHFDFLRGDEPYKSSWTAQRRTTWQLVVTRPGLHGAWLRSSRSFEHAVRRARARVRRALPAPLVVRLQELMRSAPVASPE